ncbi:aldo/keto reductase [Brevundimonas sp. S30B]|uniref:aldo/keto reductase n=1 Tax=unclassified Brevundimonas TaxID=2622653 RepID=UPI0010725AD3|nr:MULTISPECIES: aldo/keto reductase [unclassified Brevundimonas]QBX38007.1 aldo/keto reductase [Brevundimonas sp. MF30-B]TFW02639.1 aldo/keto reductase [Brevundimonas sp. S30B]
MSAQEPARNTASGTEIPLLGFGTWQLEPEDARRMVAEAIAIGYRHIDTAFIYHNEAAVGQGIADSGVARDELFVTTKIWVDNFRNGDLQRQAEESAGRLGLTPDLLLLHWPKARPPLAETVVALNDARRRGFTRHIGLSNFPSAEFRRAAALSDAPLMTNQVEYHPFLSQKTLIATASALGSSITAWSPLAQGRVADDPALRDIAEAHGKTPGQVALRWLIQQDVIAIPRTTKEIRARENFDIFDFNLTEDEMARIHALARPDGRIGDWLDPAFRWDAD